MNDDFAAPLAAHELQRLAIFPLGGVTLFPGTMVPLHIFEPRYRQMTAEAIASGRPIALALLVAPDDTPNERPPVHPVLGVGRLAHHELHEDGRYDIVLRGVGRARITGELDVDTLYRQVIAEPLHEIVEPSDPVGERADTLRAMIRGLASIHPRLAGVLTSQIEGADEPGSLVDALAPMVFPEPRQRAAVFVEPRTLARLDATIERMGTVMAQAVDAVGQTPN